MSQVLAVLNAVRKFLVALLGAVLVLLQQLDVVFPGNTWVAPTVAAVTAVLVYLVPNAEPET